MTTRAGLLLTCATGALLLGIGISTQARAADFPMKAPPVDLGWWFHGDVEAGGRFFGQKDGGSTTCHTTTIPGVAAPYFCGATRETLGKFYEYRDWRPGPFGNVFLAAGSNDGLYQIDFRAKNIGYDDQSYYLDLSKAGEHYLSLGWDETPHVYNNNATTIFNGVGSGALTVPNSLRTTLNGLLPAAGTPPLPTVANTAVILGVINSNLNEFKLGFQRDTAIVDYRWTPDPSWDVKVDYTRTDRDGTQPMGALTFDTQKGGGAYPTAAQERSGRVPLELPKPIKDTTDNANINAEYAGVSPWGKKFNVALGYGLSYYRNDNAAIQFQNPWVPDGANDQFRPLNNQIALAPDNSAHMFDLNGGIDLPWKSRYNGAVQYSIAKQNQNFLPFSVNPALNAGNICVPGTCPPFGPFPSITQSSLNGESDTLLVNNVLTTQITSELKSTARYRYYDYANNTPDTTVNGWIYADTFALAEDTRIARGTSYVKQNASGDLVWNPLSVRWLTVGGGLAWERWDRDHRDVNITDEWTGKIFLDAKPWEWSQFRASYSHSERRYDSYSTEVESNSGAGQNTYRLFDMANRDRDKTNFYLDLFLPANWTVTPTGGFRIDDYGTDPFARVTIDSVSGLPVGELGLLHDEAWNAGIEFAWSPSKLYNFTASYMHEDSHREIMANNNTAMLDVNVTDRIDTWLFAANMAVVPDKLDVKGALTYSRVRASFAQFGGGVAPFAGAIPTNAGVLGTTAFPNQTMEFTRIDLQSKYRFDPAWVQQMGWKGEMYAKLRVVWEHNAVSDWAAVNQNYLVLIGGTAAPYSKGIFMGWNNPNYNVQVIMASLGFKW